MQVRFLFIAVFICTKLIAQEVPSPAPKQTEKITLKGATIHVGREGKVIENGNITFENGKIISINSNSEAPSDGKIIDVSTQHIYPGFIALNTILGLTDIEAVRASNDVVETGSLNANAKSIVAYNTDSRVTPTVRSNGITYAQIVPRGGRISGTSSVVQLDAWNWEDAVVKESDGVHINWPTLFKVKGWWAEPDGYELNAEYDKQVEEIKTYLLEAKSYNFSQHEKTNLRFEGMKGLFSKKENFYVHVDFVKEIQHVIAFAEEMDLKLVLVGASDSYQIPELLAAKKISVILDRTHSLPNRDEDDIHQPYKTPAILQQAGVSFALSNEGFWQVRNLPFQAGTAVAFGLPKEAALEAITFAPAKIVGLENSIGSLEIGKDATIIVSSGDVLDMKTSQITHSFIAGREVNLGNKQIDLYKKFLTKYGLKAD